MKQQTFELLKTIKSTVKQPIANTGDLCKLKRQALPKTAYGGLLFMRITATPMPQR
jgi:hypothetical protein